MRVPSRVKQARRRSSATLREPIADGAKSRICAKSCRCCPRSVPCLSHGTAGQQAAIVASAQDWAKAQTVGKPQSGNHAPLATIADRAVQVDRVPLDTAATRASVSARLVGYLKIVLRCAALFCFRSGRPLLKPPAQATSKAEATAVPPGNLYVFHQRYRESR